MNFGDAIEAVKNGKTATRASWTEGAQIGTFMEGDLKVVGWRSDEHPTQVYHPTAADMLEGDWEIS